VAKKSNTSMFRPGLKLSVLITGTAFGLMACSDSGGDAVDDGSTTTGGTTMGSTTTGTMMGAGGTSSGTDGTSTGAGGTGASTAEDFDPMAEDFTCIADWQKILGFRINNFLDHLDEAVAVAENPAGGVYPVGTILQHFPTEAMVKRKAGFSPDTKDWEFFLLTLNQDGTTTIASRGTTEITTAQGQACASCHSMADAEWDFVCNTYGDANNGNPNCGFDLMAGQLDPPIAMDPRCE